MKKLSDFFITEEIYLGYKCYVFSNHSIVNRTGFQTIITVGFYSNSCYSDPPSCNLNIDDYKKLSISIIEGNVNVSKIHKYVNNNYPFIYNGVPPELILEFMCDNLGIPYEQKDIVAKEIVKSNKVCSECGGTGKLDFLFYKRICGCSL
jgi:hypothetical protein